MPMEEHAPRRQNQRVVGVWQLVRLQEVEAVEFAAAAGKAVRKEVRRAGVIRRGTRPMHAALRLQARVADALERRGQVRHLLPNRRRVVVGITSQRAQGQLGHGGRRSRGQIADGCAWDCAQRMQLVQHAAGQIAHDFPIRARRADRLDCGAHHLHAAIGVGEGAIFFGKTGSGQDDVCIRAGLIEEDVLTHDQVQILQTMPRMRQIRFAHQRILAHDVEGAQRAAARAVHHLRRGKSRLRVERRAPGPGELGADLRVVHALVARENVEQPAGVRTALHIVLPAQWIETRTLRTQMAAHQRQVSQRQRVVGAMRALTDAHTPVDRGPPGRGVKPRGLDDVRGGHAGHLFGISRRPTFQALDVIGKAFGARADELAVVPGLAYDDVRQRLPENHIGARLLAQPDFRKVGQFDVPRIGHDQMRAVLAHRLLEKRGDDRMRFRGVRTGDDEALQRGHFGNRVRHGRRADRHL